MTDPTEHETHMCVVHQSAYPTRPGGANLRVCEAARLSILSAPMLAVELCQIHKVLVRFPKETDSDPDETVDLTVGETLVLAEDLMWRHLDSDWLRWDDVPYLSEDAFDRLEEMVVSRVAAFRKVSLAIEDVLGVDGSELYELANGATR